MPAISVVVPVYKVEAYLDACVESVLGQTFTDLELILVDDGSPDRCGEMCDAWAKKDARVVVVHQPNGGVSAARNTGLDCRRGAYVAFLDADDTLPPDALELLHAKAIEHNFDVITAGLTVIYDDHTRTRTCPAFVAFSPAELRPYIEDFFFSMMAFFPVGRLILGDLLDRHHLRFNPTLKIGEDANFSSLLFAHSQTVANLNVPLYNYIKRAEYITATSQPRLDGVENARMMKIDLLRMLRALGFSAEADAYEADAARMSGYGVYFNQLNHAGLCIPFCEHRRRLRELLANPVARAVIMKDLAQPPGGRDPRDPRAAAVGRFFVSHRLIFALTAFIRLKSWLIRRRGRSEAPA